MVIRFLVSLIIITGVLSFFHTFLQKMGLGQFPGDLYIENGDFKLYLPFSTSLIVCGVFYIIYWAIGKI